MIPGQRLHVCLRCWYPTVESVHCDAEDMFPLSVEPFALLGFSPRVGRNTTAEDVRDRARRIAEDYSNAAGRAGLSREDQAKLAEDLKSRLRDAAAVLEEFWCGKPASEYVAFCRGRWKHRGYTPKQAAKEIRNALGRDPILRALSWSEIKKRALAGGGVGAQVVLAILMYFVFTVGGFTILGITIVAATPFLTANPLAGVGLAVLAVFFLYLFRRIGKGSREALKKASSELADVLAGSLAIHEDIHMLEAFAAYASGGVSSKQLKALRFGARRGQIALLEKYSAILRKGVDRFMERNVEMAKDRPSLPELAAALDEKPGEFGRCLMSAIADEIKQALLHRDLERGSSLAEPSTPMLEGGGEENGSSGEDEEE